MTRNLLLSLFLLLAAAPTVLADCRPGEIAWTDTGMEVRIQAVFPDGQVSVVYNSVNFTFRREQLATQGCYRELCSGQQVVTDTGMTATVNGVFSNGQFSVKYNTVNFTFRREQLAPTNPYCPPDVGGIRIGDTVWTDSGMQARVAAIFPDRRLDVVYNTVHFQFTRDQLAAQGCLGNLCSGDLVLTRSGMKARVNGFFSDNRSVSVVFNTVNFKFDYNDLAKTWQ